MNNITKKQVADNIFKQLNPHFSTLLGSGMGYGIETGSQTMTVAFNSALKKWFEQNDSSELVALLRTAQVTNVISEKELDAFLDDIEQAK